MAVSLDSFCDSTGLESCTGSSTLLLISLVFTVTLASNLHGPAASRGEIWACSFPCKDRERCCCLIRDTCSRAVQAAKHNVARRCQTSPLLSASIFPRPPRQRKARASVSGRRVQMVSFCFSSKRTAEEQEGSVPARQSESGVPSVKCSGELHRATGIGGCPMKHISSGLPRCSCRFPASSVSFLAAAVHLFIFNVSLG